MKINLENLFESANKRELILGRESEELILHHQSVSRKHALIQKNEQNQILITDLNSRNGILVNGKRIKSCVLNPGDVVRMGSVSFVVELETNEIIHGVMDWIEASYSIRKKLGW